MNKLLNFVKKEMVSRGIPLTDEHLAAVMWSIREEIHKTNPDSMFGGVTPENQIKYIVKSYAKEWNFSKQVLYN